MGVSACILKKTLENRYLNYDIQMLLNIGVLTSFFFLQRKLLWAVEKVFTAVATELGRSWATGSGLPICCISGLAVAEAGRGSGCRALEEATVSKLFGNNYWIFTEWLCGHARQMWRQTNGRTEIGCICRGKKSSKAFNLTRSLK